MEPSEVTRSTSPFGDAFDVPARDPREPRPAADLEMAAVLDETFGSLPDLAVPSRADCDRWWWGFDQPA